MTVKEVEMRGEGGMGLRIWAFAEFWEERLAGLTSPSVGGRRRDTSFKVGPEGAGRQWL